MTECICRHCRCLYNILLQCFKIRFHAVRISSGSVEANLKGEGAETSRFLGAEYPKWVMGKALLGAQSARSPSALQI